MIPNVDQSDIIDEHPLFNGGKYVKTSHKHQHHAEYTQSSYLRIRSLEEAYAIRNYMDPDFTKKQNEQQGLNSKKVNSTLLLTKYDRPYAI